MRKRQTFSREFKLEAVRLLERGNKPAADLARELGIRRNRLYRWKEQLANRGEMAFPGKGRRTHDQDGEIARLKIELERVKEERDILKKSHTVLCQGIAVKAQFIHNQRTEHRINRLCQALGVSRSGYYAWRRRELSRRLRENQRLLKRIRRIRDIHRLSRENYGEHKTWRALHTLGERCGRHRVARLRRRHGIIAKRVRRFRESAATRQSLPPAPNLLQRDFIASQMNRVWVGDVTIITTRRGWLHLAVLIDLYSRRIVGWSMSQRNDLRLITDALQMAMATRRPPPGLIHHTDQGQTYASATYRALLSEHSIVQSMSRKGNCLDNAVAESFCSNLNNELVHHASYEDRAEARAAIFDYMEVFYNRQRIHQSLGYVSPVDFERRRGVA